MCAVQGLLAVDVTRRLLRTARGRAVLTESGVTRGRPLVSVVVPVLNEALRLSGCLAALCALGPEVGEILVVDGGSVDGTQALARSVARRDPRVRVLDALPIPADWNGKAWGLEVGRRTAADRLPWLLTIDADVEIQAPLVAAMLQMAQQEQLDALSVATAQLLGGPGQALLHPAFLTTLVYRFGSPGGVMRTIGAVQANGQCFLARRRALDAIGGFAVGRGSRCEDVTVARALVAAGRRAGFYEAGELARVTMYADWRDLWRNWPRSLPMRDQYTRYSSYYGLAMVLLVQAMPLPVLVLAGASARIRRAKLLVGCNALLACMRVGILVGTARAYPRRPWTYWLSPCSDLPVTGMLWMSALRRKHVWRGRVLLER
jgi:dolichol-phosphate mannosyltransferase